MVTLEIEVSDEVVALEIGYALSGRAMDLHEQACGTDAEYIAKELRDVSKEIRDQYE